MAGNLIAMSGQHAIRGFIYQTIVSVLQSLSDNNWEYLTLEPSTPEEKVDLQWVDGEGNKTIQQVKSSINNFAKPDILRWLEGMVNDVPNAKTYELVLIGNRENSVSTFIEKLNQQEQSDLGTVLTPYIGNLKVRTLIFDPDGLQSQVQNELHRFLSKLGFRPSHDDLFWMMGGLTYQFFQFSAVGRTVSRAEWGEILLQWVTSNYKQALHIEGRIDGMTVGVYDQPGRKLVTTFTAIPFKASTAELLKTYIQEAREHFETASSIQLPQVQGRPNPESRFGRAVNQQIALDAVTFDEQTKSYFSDKVRRYLGASLPDGFFNLGDLATSPMGSADLLFGNEIEKGKYAVLNRLKNSLGQINKIEILFDFLGELLYLPLVLQNKGNSHDEGITVTLKVPDSVHIVEPREFYQPDDADLLKLLTKGDRFIRLLRVNGDSFVDAYPPDHVLDAADSVWETQMSILFQGNDLSIRRDKFLQKIERLLDRKLFHDLPGYTQLRYYFGKLNPNDRMAFPAFLLFVAKEGFVIDYEITSKNTSAVQTGQLNCVIGTAK